MVDAFAEGTPPSNKGYDEVVSFLNTIIHQSSSLAVAGRAQVILKALEAL